MAAHQIALTIASVTFTAPQGIVGAAAVLVGQAVGAGDFARDGRRPLRSAPGPPSCCSAASRPGAPANVPRTAVNVILALCGSTLATYFASVRLRGKVSAADVANAALAGGVAIGSTVLVAGIHPGAQLAGIAATITIAAVAGLVGGRVIAVLGSRSGPYVDSEELEAA